MATTKADFVEPNLTECAICHDTFTVPKILSCGHVMCRDCLVTWLQSQPQAACPLCRCFIVDPIKQGGRSVEEVADGLPTDLALTAMVEAETLLSRQHVCCVCDDVAAMALCFQCGDMFCQQCCKMHKKQKATKHHEVEELSTLTTEKLAAHHPATCPDHNENVSEIHCPTHGTSVCLMCAATTHRDCPKLVSLQSQVGELTAELVQLCDKLTERAAKADAWLGLLDKNVAGLQRQSQAALDEMKNVCDRLKAAIEARFVQVSDMTLKLVSDFTTKASDLKNLISQKRSKLAAHNILAKHYKTFTEHKHFKDMISMVKSRLPDLDTVDSLPDDLQLNQKLILSIDLQAVTDAERIILGLGAVTMTPGNAVEKTHRATQSAQGSTDPAVDQRPSTTRSQNVLSASGGHRRHRRHPGGRLSGSEGLVTQFNPMTATSVSGVLIDTGTQEDINKSPFINCIMSGPLCEVLYMVDSNNNSIKLFSLKLNSLISTLALDVNPFRIVIVTDSLLAVTTDTTVIKLIDVTEISKPIVLRTVTTKRRYYGISVYRPDIDDVTLIVSCGHDKTGAASVDMITMAGQHVRTIVTSQSLPDLKCPWYLHTDTRRDVLYLSDRDARCVFCVQPSTGRVLGQLKHPQLSAPCQVCTDSEGNLYVADGGSECVLVRSVSGAWRVLLSQTELGERECPRAVCVTDTSLVVSHTFLKGFYYTEGKIYKIT